MSPISSISNRRGRRISAACCYSFASSSTTTAEAYCFHNAEDFQFHELDNAAFKVSNSPTPARLTTSLTVFDSAISASLNLNVDLTWSVVDRPRPIRDTIHFELAPGCNVTAHVSNAGRLATVSGTVSDGTTNFSPDPGEGFVDYHNAEQVTIGGDTCPPPEPR
jgi:hypothetical protein